MTQHNLPEAATSFVGRSDQLEDVRGHLASCRLVTLTGPGGVGKTRLAVEAAGRLRTTFPHGIWLVDLASVSDPEDVAPAALAALHVRDQSERAAEQLVIDHLRDRRLLIVLDNCEHLLDRCAALVAKILERAAGVHVLATSREPLNIRGEQLLHVPPLSTPPSSDLPIETLSRYESVRLLEDRARNLLPDFAIDDANAAAVAQLCVHLDGVPLAIELAAVRLRTLDVAELVERLADRFELLVGGDRAANPRQQTLRALIQWSYELCSADERLLWERLSVFAGTFDLAAADGVCAGDGLPEVTVMNALDQLVAKSIVLVERRGSVRRFRLLESMREYGAHLLAEHGRVQDLRRRHREHYRKWARQMVEGFCGPDQARAVAQLRADHANLRAALSWSLEAPGEEALGAVLAADLRYDWALGGSLDEGRRWLSRALSVAPPGSRERGQALWVSIWISLLRGDLASVDEQLPELRQLAETLQDPGLQAHAAQYVGHAILFAGDARAAVPHLQRALVDHARAGHQVSRLTTYFQLTVALAYADDLDGAAETCEAGRAFSDTFGEQWAGAYLRWAGGIVAWRRGDLRAAAAAARQALELQRQLEDAVCVALSIDLLGWVAAAEKRATEAADLLGTAASVWRRMGTGIDRFGPDLGGDSAQAARLARKRLGAAGFAATSDAGARRSVIDAVEHALDAMPAECYREEIWEPLSKREVEVAQLIAMGMTNREAADHLVLSPRTIDGHLERIYAKLGFRVRSQLAAWVAQRNLRVPDRE